MFISFRVLEKIGPRTFAKHLRTFVDYIVQDFANPPPGTNHYINRGVEALSDLIWRCNILSLDRVILMLVSLCGKTW